MKRNLKKYNDFINEELTAVEKLSNTQLANSLQIPLSDSIRRFLLLRSKFWDNIIDMTGDLSPISFSSMCKKNLNPEEDYREMQSLMDKKGWDIQSIKNLFSPKVDEICGYDIAKFVRGERTEDFLKVVDKFKSTESGNLNYHEFIGEIVSPFRSCLDSQNGHCDVYLYFLFKELGLNKNFISLGGEGWSNYNEGDELWIRYRYGYHKTKYGQIMLDQMGYTSKRFKEEALVYLQQYIKDYWEESLIRSLEKTLSKQSGGKTYPLSKSLRGLLTRIDIKEYTLVEEDRMIIFTNEIASLINKEGLAKVEAKDIANALIEQYEWIDSENDDESLLQEVDGDVIFWGKFKVDWPIVTF